MGRRRIGLSNLGSTALETHRVRYSELWLCLAQELFQWVQLWGASCLVSRNDEGAGRSREVLCRGCKERSAWAGVP